MTGLNTDSVDAAVVSARAALGVDSSQPARTWTVARMRPDARGYVLVVFGTPERAVAIAAVDPGSGEVLESARLPGRERHALITADEAIVRAGLGPDSEARLVWGPSSATRSRFYPLWQLQSAERRIWVDSVRGDVWQTLDTPRGGGSGQA
jgi:hypothetical protein